VTRRSTIATTLLVVALAAAASAARVRRQSEELLQVVEPSSAVASAHPWVNVVVSFGRTKTGAPADPATFHARIGRDDVTAAFEPIYDGGTQTGARAALSNVKIGRRPRNRLRLSVRAVRVADAKGPPSRDIDRVKFGAEEVPDRAPSAMIAVSAPVVVPDDPITFDASGSHDPDGDEIEYLWDFGDGTTSTERTATHAFPAGLEGDVVVTLQVSDGQLSTTATATLPTVPGVDPGRTEGILRVEATGQLEFGAVAVGATATRTLTVSNVDPTPTSQVKIRAAAANGAAFAVAPSALVALDPGQSATLDVTFAPPATGHHDSRIGLVASATNRVAVSFVAHGYGGSAPGSGPTLVALPVYTVFPDLGGIMPDGRTFAIDPSINECGPTTRDVCLADGDCATRGDTCTASTSPYPTNELCSDSTSLFLLSDDGTFTETNADADTERGVTLLRLDHDGAGNITGREILDRTTTETEHLACDGTPAGQGGLVYLAEFRNVADSANCFRDEREALVRVNKGNGNTQVVSGFSRIDEAPGVGECDDRDPVEQLATTPDGMRMVAGFESSGLWRIRPTPLFLTPDVSDAFQLHPDGSVLFTRARDRGTEGMIDLYRLTDDQVQHGALSLAAMTPCASFAVPNNALGEEFGRTTIVSLVAGPASLTTRDGTALVSFISGVRPAPSDVFPFGNVRGIVAFSLPPDATSCTAVGIVGLEASQLAR